MELLCVLAPPTSHGKGKSLSELAKTFDTLEAVILGWITELRQDGFGIVVSDNGVYIPMSHWPVARRAADAYWRRVHETEMAVA